MRSGTEHLFKRFRDLTAADINCDMHMHTCRTDATETAGSMIRQAAAVGLSRIAVTEHVRRSSDWFPEFAQEVRAERQPYAMEVLVGCETKALDTHGTLDASEAILSECDIVLGTVHSFFDARGVGINWRTLSPEEHAECEFRLALGILEGAPADVLAHPGGITFYRFGSFPADKARKLLEASLQRGVAIEINSRYLGGQAWFLQLCAEINPLVSIASDAHHLEGIGKCRDLLRRQGIGKEGEGTW